MNWKDITKQEVKEYLEQAHDKRMPALHAPYLGPILRARPQLEKRIYDVIAHHLMESERGIATIMIKMNGGNLTLHGRGGIWNDDDRFIAEPNTASMRLLGYDGTTIATFGATICDLVTYRFHCENPLKGLMVPNASDVAQRTKSHLAHYQK